MLTTEHTLEHISSDVENYFEAVGRNHGHDAAWHMSALGERMIDLTWDADANRHKPSVYHSVTNRIAAEIFGEYNGAHYTVKDDLDALTELPIRVSLGSLPLLVEFRLPIDQAAKQVEAIMPAVKNGIAAVNPDFGLESFLDSLAIGEERVAASESKRRTTRVPFLRRIIPTEKVPTYESAVVQLLDR